MEENGLFNFIQENKLNDIVDPREAIECKYYDEADFLKESATFISQLNIFSLNIRSLSKNGGNLSCFLNTLENRFDIIVLTEIGSRNISTVENLLPGFEFMYVTPDDNYYGGVGIYTNEMLKDVCVLTELSIVNSCNCSKCQFESLFISFVHGNMTYILGGIYRHPNGSMTHFIDDMEKIIQSIDKKYTVILAGDINIDIIKFEMEDILNYLSTLLSLQFLPYITLPTRITSHSATCIDHIFIRNAHKNEFNPIYAGIFFSDISDHLPCFVSFAFNKPGHTKRPLTRLFGESNCQKFVNHMTNENWDVIYNSHGDWYLKFITTVKRIFDMSFPLVQVSRKRIKDKPWMTQDLKIRIRKNHQLFSKTLRSSSEHHIAMYHRSRNSLRKCLENAEIKYYNDLFEDNKNSSFNLWKSLNPILNPKKVKSRSPINKIMKNGETITDARLMAEAMNSHFCDIGTDLQSQLPDCGSQNKNYLPERVSTSFFLLPVCGQDVLDEIKRLNPKKSSGPDTIGGKVIQLCPDIFAYNLTKIFNNSIEIGEYPMI